MRLAVVIPAYNERDTIGLILPMVTRALPHVEKQLVIVDDCSSPTAATPISPSTPVVWWSWSRRRRSGRLDSASPYGCMSATVARGRPCAPLLMRWRRGRW